MSDYCIGCLYCRPLSQADGTNACHYYLDTGIKPPYTATECAARKPVSNAEQEKYMSARKSTDYHVPPKKRHMEDDYIFDSRGADDGWYSKR